MLVGGHGWIVLHPGLGGRGREGELVLSTRDIAGGGGDEQLLFMVEGGGGEQLLLPGAWGGDG